MLKAAKRHTHSQTRAQALRGTGSDGESGGTIYYIEIAVRRSKASQSQSSPESKDEPDEPEDAADSEDETAEAREEEPDDEPESPQSWLSDA